MANFGKMFGDAGAEAAKRETHPRRETKWLHYTKLLDNEKQYRKSTGEEDILALAALIEADKGVLQPLLVRKCGTDEYEIIAGHHRKKACAWLAEEKGLKEYEFLPCIIENLDDVRAEFQLYSSNGFAPKTDYEKMYELQRMKELIEQYPEEFPHLKTGRMVEKLAKQMHISRTSAGEYITIGKNLGEKGMEAFRQGELNKSAALEMAALPEQEQDELIGKGVTTQKEIREHKEKQEPSDRMVLRFYKHYAISRVGRSREELAERLKEAFGRSHSCGAGGVIDYSCSLRGVTLGNSCEITWAQFVKRVNLLEPPSEEKKAESKPEAEMPTEMEDVPESGTQEITPKLCDTCQHNGECVGKKTHDAGCLGYEEPEEEYTAMYFWREQDEKLELMKAQIARGAQLPKIVMERQKTIVYALQKLAMEECVADMDAAEEGTPYPRNILQAMDLLPELP